MAQHGIIGDAVGVDLPQAQPDEDSIKDERAMASFSKTKEFERLKNHINLRIEFYKKFLPDGRPVSKVMPTPEEWQSANIVIEELQSLINAYELAKDVVSGEQSIQR